MGHKLKATELTNKLLSEDSFSWYPSDDRIMRFDKFVGSMKSMFSVVDWSGDEAEANRAKIDLFNLVAGSKLRETISEVLQKNHKMLFDEMISLTRYKLFKGISPILSLSRVLSQDEKFGEPFEQFYSRVLEASAVVDWEGLTGDNIKKAMIAITLACKTNNPYVKGHCSGIKTFADINLDDIVATALEFEDVNRKQGFKFSANIGSSCSKKGFDKSASESRPIFSFGEKPSSTGDLFGSSTKQTSKSSGFTFGGPAKPYSNAGFNFGGKEVSPEEQRLLETGCKTPFSSVCDAGNIFLPKEQSSAGKRKPNDSSESPAVAPKKVALSDQFGSKN